MVPCTYFNCFPTFHGTNIFVCQNVRLRCLHHSFWSYYLLIQSNNAKHQIDHVLLPGLIIRGHLHYQNPQFFGSRNLVYLYIYISVCVCFLQVLLQSKSISYDGNIFQNNITVWGGRFPSRVLADPLAQQVGPPAAVPEAKNRWAKAWWVLCSISPGRSCFCFCLCLWWCYVVVVAAAAVGVVVVVAAAAVAAG